MTVTKNINTMHLDATGQAHTGPGFLKRVLLFTDHADGMRAICYDGTAATDPPITSTLYADPGTDQADATRTFEIGAEFATGVHVVMTGAAGDCLIVLGRGTE